jgi:hypothetical protein
VLASIHAGELRAFDERHLDTLRPRYVIRMIDIEIWRQSREVLPMRGIIANDPPGILDEMRAARSDKRIVSDPPRHYGATCNVVLCCGRPGLGEFVSQSDEGGLGLNEGFD